MYREAYGKPQIPALKPSGFRTETEYRILGNTIIYSRFNTHTQTSLYIHFYLFNALNNFQFCIAKNKKAAGN